MDYKIAAFLAMASSVIWSFFFLISNYGHQIVRAALLINVIVLVFAFRRAAKRNQINAVIMLVISALIYAYTPYLFSYAFDITYLLEVEPKFLDESLAVVNVYIALTVMTYVYCESNIFKMHELYKTKIYDTSPACPNYVFSMVLAVVFMYEFYSSGALASVISGQASRFELTEQLETGKIWLIQYLMTGGTIAYVYFSVKKRAELKISTWDFFSGAAVFAYWLAQVAIGNRRGLLTVVLASLAIYLLRGGNVKTFSKVMFATLGIGGLIGVLRIVGDSSELIILASSFLGEFIYPWYTFFHQIQSASAPTLNPTWASAPMDFMWSKLTGSQYLSAAQLFATSLHSGEDYAMGYAYMPVAETYKTAGVLGAMITGPAMILSLLALLKATPNLPWLYVIIFSLCLDINRSDFFSMVAQVLCIALGFKLNSLGGILPRMKRGSPLALP